jgi:hypothetical protein
MGDRAKWGFLLTIGGLLFNWPFLSIFDRVLPYYLFGAWALIIITACILSVFQGRGGQG